MAETGGAREWRAVASEPAPDSYHASSRFAESEYFAPRERFAESPRELFAPPPRESTFGPGSLGSPGSPGSPSISAASSEPEHMYAPPYPDGPQQPPDSLAPTPYLYKTRSPQAVVPY